MKRRVPSFRFNSFSNSTPGSDLPSLSEGKTTLHSKVIGYTPPAVQEVELSFVPLCLNCVDRLDPAKSTRSRIGDSLDERVPFTTLDPSSSSSLSLCTSKGVPLPHTDLPKQFAVCLILLFARSPSMHDHTVDSLFCSLFL